MDIKIIIYIVFGIIYLLLKAYKSQSKKEKTSGYNTSNGESGNWSFEDWMEKLEGESEDTERKEKARQTAYKTTERIGEKVEHIGQKTHQLGRKVHQIGEKAHKIGEDVKQIGEDVQEIGHTPQKQLKPEKSYKPLQYEGLKNDRRKREAEIERKKKEVKEKQGVEAEEILKKMKASDKYTERERVSRNTSDVVEGIKNDPEWARKAVIYNEIINKKYD